MKYKHAESEGWYYAIDENGNKSASWTAKNKPGYYQSMMDWVAKGNEILPLYSVEDLTEKEAEEAKQALESQKQTIIQLVKSVEYHFSPVSRHPDTDGKWQEWVGKLWVIYDSGKIQELPEKPY